MQIIFRFFTIVLCGLLTVSCSSKAKFESYDKQLNEIRSDVRSIRIIADQMRNEVINMKTSVGIMNENSEKQSKEIENAKETQKKLAEAIDSIKSSVVKLETETLPQKRDELKELNKQDDSGITLITKKVDGITVVEAVKDADVTDTKKIKYTEAVNVNSGFGYAVKDGVILWHSPTINSEIVEVLLSWQQVTILGSISSEGVKWLKIKTADYTGYVNSKFVMVSDAGVPAIEPQTVKQNTVKTVVQTDQFGCVTSDNGLKMRIKPAPDSEGVRNVRYMSRLKLMKLSDDGVWYNVSYNGDSGYVYAKFIKPDKDGKCETE